MNSAKRKAAIQAETEIKEQQNITAMDLSANLEEAVEKSLVKSSADEARPCPR